MPIIKSAKKRVKTAAKRTEANRHYKSRMLTLIKNIVKFVKGGETEKAVSILNETYSAIDVAAKKGIVHKNNAARKKARVSKAVGGKSAPVAEKKVQKATPKKAAPTKKPAAAKKAAAPKKAPAKKAAK